jgi:hypothetical protein
MESPENREIESAKRRAGRSSPIMAALMNYAEIAASGHYIR